MISLPISLEIVEIIIDDVFRVIEAESEEEVTCPEITLNAAWFKLYGIEKFICEAEKLLDQNRMADECREIKNQLALSLSKIEIMAENVMFQCGEEH